MKKIFIGGFGACSAHNEKNAICSIVKREEYEIINNFKEADIIVITDTCLGLERFVDGTFQYIKKVLAEKKKESIVIVSGCLTKGLQYELTEERSEILKQVILVKPEVIIEYIARLIKEDFDEKEINELKLPFTVNCYSIRLSSVNGCMNHCSFCKRNYMNFNLQSVPFELIERLASGIETVNYPIYHIQIFSSNLSLYGVDLYGSQKSHEVIKELTKPEKIKYAYVGAIINMYPELINEILSNPKIKEIYISIESGSPRIYELMNRPIPLAKLIEIIKLIKRVRPDIIIDTEFITGFPTETIDDLKRTIELAQELDVFPIDIHPYENSVHIPSSNFEQHSLAYTIESANYAYSKLGGLHSKFIDRIRNGEMLIVKKSKQRKLYEVLLTNGAARLINFEQLNREYQIGEVVEPNIVKPKQLIKNR